MIRSFGVFLLVLLFQNGLFSQILKQKIEWVQYFDGTGISKQKRTINYNKKGEPTSEYLKREGVEEKIAVYQYDKKGRLLKVKDDSGTELYTYYKGFYVLKEFNGDNLSWLRYCYTNSSDQIIEEKLYRNDRDSIKPKNLKLYRWTISTYNPRGLLIGTRFKQFPDNVSPTATKILYTYKPNTNLRLSSKWYFLDEKGKEKASNCFRNRTYTYNDKNQLISEGEGCHDDQIVYKYKDGQLWTKTTVDHGIDIKIYKDVEVYKDGILVRKKFYEYHHRSSDDTKKLGEKGLRKIIDYQYQYNN
ncbi:MAG: hypothetical protein GY810_13440 [Aureispira sp.]|nr:hypothetical protein [Aureispira sp.]